MPLQLDKVGGLASAKAMDAFRELVTTAVNKRSSAGEWRSTVKLRKPHVKQAQFIDSPAKRKVIRAGRRGGKTVGIAIYAGAQFLEGRRVLYAAPTEDQVETFWWEIKNAFQDAIDSGALYKNETKHILEIPGTKTRIRAKTAWNADTLRGDYADVLILDEFQLMNEDTWGVVGAPMLLDNDGDAVFIYTPPSLNSAANTKARDPRHASKLFKKAEADEEARWAAFHFSSRENPFISVEALAELTSDMTALAIAQEIEAEDRDDVPGALWNRELIERQRIDKAPELVRLVIGVDPPGGATEAGIVAAGIDAQGFYYVLGDMSLRGSPDVWAQVVVNGYRRFQADRVVGEKNYGGDMVENTLRTAEDGKDISFKYVVATRGKAVRAEPISALYERGKVFHVGEFPMLENEMCNWLPGNRNSPNRLDAAVWALTDLRDGNAGPLDFGPGPSELAEFFGGTA